MEFLPIFSLFFSYSLSLSNTLIFYMFELQSESHTYIFFLFNSFMLFIVYYNMEIKLCFSSVLLYSCKSVSHLNFYFNLLLLQLTAEQCKLLLIQAICDILKKCKDDKFRIVTLPDEDTVPSLSIVTDTPAQESALNRVPDEASGSTESGANVCINDLLSANEIVLFEII